LGSAGSADCRLARSFWLSFSPGEASSFSEEKEAKKLLFSALL
jgi:hypothetical protein